MSFRIAPIQLGAGPTAAVRCDGGATGFCGSRYNRQAPVLCAGQAIER
jgi:hypothetical protein